MIVAVWTHGALGFRRRLSERGVGLTLACRSAACATVVSGARIEAARREAAVRLPGGGFAARVAQRSSQ